MSKSSALTIRLLLIFEMQLVTGALILKANFLSYALLFGFVTVIFLTVCSYHVTYSFQSEFTLYSCLNVKELLARSRREI